jgi:hypothetical protein
VTTAGGGAGQALAGWEAAACGLLDRAAASPATDALVLSAAGLASDALSLASLWNASRATADKAYRELAWLGYLVKGPGRACRVASAAALQAAAQRERALAGQGRR